jgi:hypothetical protein
MGDEAIRAFASKLQKILLQLHHFKLSLVQCSGCVGGMQKNIHSDRGELKQRWSMTHSHCRVQPCLGLKFGKRQLPSFNFLNLNLDILLLPELRHSLVSACTPPFRPRNCHTMLHPLACDNSLLRQHPRTCRWPVGDIHEPMLTIAS